VAWLALLADLGLGGCLADDMGLGKTVQTIAFLLARRAARPHDSRPALIVCPTSVIGNWERELARFAPTLPVVRHHGPERAWTIEDFKDIPPHAVVVTSYSLLRRDRALLGEIDWAVAVLDEAQNVKNAASGQAVAARSLRAGHRFALTGTPVENRLAELWSILEFCTPGFLGPLERFRRRFAIPIERYRDDRAADTLRRLVRPFVLRRVKSDPRIIADLPPKQEVAVVCTLTREQATLYQAAVEEAMANVEAAEGIRRRGLILALLTALKQICNHPAHYLRERGPLSGRSGKLDRLTEMLEETVASGDRALVFTQFREMGERLVPHLQQALKAEVLFLHGGVPRAARDAMVRRFQEEEPGAPIFVLSLKAGGTGLNLTRATRVFHFDRWWNPAVEDQATDRAHRIGQRRLVQVYRLLSTGTVEEKIDALLTDKRALADRVVGAGESWITELANDELRRLVVLSSDAVVEDPDAEPGPPEVDGRRRKRR
jgi:SNF2 family DNA or RNA helicase